MIRALIRRFITYKGGETLRFSFQITGSPKNIPVGSLQLGLEGHGANPAGESAAIEEAIRNTKHGMIQCGPNRIIVWYPLDEIADDPTMIVRIYTYEPDGDPIE